MEASALPRPAALSRPRPGVPAPLLRVRSDDQLVALFRAGSDDAFRAIHDRYRVRLLAYARQMLAGSTADAEDALQEVFVRAHAALLASSAPISLRAWLYRIAHNRCIDQLRRPTPIPSEITPGAQPALSRGSRHDPPVEAERSEDLRRLVADVHSLPEQQRSALLMRELQGLSYEELAVALGISVAAVKSVLLRARGGVLDAAEARDAPCAEIRLDLVSAHDRGVRASGRVRRHLRECERCCDYRGELREMRRQVAALAPVGPLGHLGVIFGLGGGGAGAGGGLAAGGGAAALGGGVGVTATKVAVLVCCAAVFGSAGALRPQDSRHAGRSGRIATPRHATPAAPAEDSRLIARIAGATMAPMPVPSPARASTPAPARANRTAGQAGGAPAATEAPLTGQDGYGTSTDPASGTLGLDAATGAAPASSSAGGAVATADPSSPAGDPAGGATRPGAASAAGTGAAPPAGSPSAATGTSSPGAGAAAGSPSATAASATSIVQTWVPRPAPQLAGAAPSQP